MNNLTKMDDLGGKPPDFWKHPFFFSTLASQKTHTPKTWIFGIWALTAMKINGTYVKGWGNPSHSNTAMKSPGNLGVNATLDTPPKLNCLPLKNGGLENYFPIGVVYVQGQTGKLLEGKILWRSCEMKMTSVEPKKIQVRLLKWCNYQLACVTHGNCSCPFSLAGSKKHNHFNLPLPPSPHTKKLLGNIDNDFQKTITSESNHRKIQIGSLSHWSSKINKVPHCIQPNMCNKFYNPNQEGWISFAKPTFCQLSHWKKLPHLKKNRKNLRCLPFAFSNWAVSPNGIH